jgi:Copper type II ascorbate-dependent monooxygenase, C-terminal domain
MRAMMMVFLLGACGGSGGADDDVTPDAPSADGWQPLIAKSWQLQPGDEKTSDLAIDSLDRDAVIGGLRPLAPIGTHHTLLFKGQTGTNMIYASGVGTNELMFPPGKALRISAGTLMGLQLHIFNQTDGTLEGTSGVEMLEVDPATVTDEIDMFLPGPKELMIPAGLETTIAGTCTVTSSYQVFALFPHMHQLGTHLKTTITAGGVEHVLNDAPYNFEHQAVLTFEPIQLSPGDTIKTECTWMNTTAQPVTYGESSTTEMCYSIMYRFPRGTEEFCEN